MAHYSFKCTACGLNIATPESMAGEYIDCPKCNLSLRVPSLPKAPPPSMFSPPPNTSQQSEDEDVEEDDDDDYKSSRQHRSPRPRRRLRPRSRFCCPYCGSEEHPLIRSKVSGGGWVIFVIVLLIFFPLCWVGLLMRERYHVCYDCGVRVGGY